MRNVGVLGYGMVPVGEHWGQSAVDLAGAAVQAARHDAGVDRLDLLVVANMLAACGPHGQLNLGAQIADWSGLGGIEAFKAEAACASGGSAFRAGWLAVASGQVDLALVVGVEKMTETLGPEVTLGLASAADADYEVPHGPSFVALNALIMQRYMHEYGWKHEHFAPFSIVAHDNASRNPYARLQDRISAEAYRKARMICNPINLLDASPIGDGAAAVLLAPLDRFSPRPGRTPLRVAGCTCATDSLAIHDRREPLRLQAAEESAARAYAMAGIGPDGIDFFELHDAFSIMSALSLEACGFAAPGQGPRLGLDGALAPGARLPIATHGGLKARGHPVGATGVYQIVEVVRQLWGEAGRNQLERAVTGMAQNVGGSGATIVTTILQTRN
jgi:acetyl-CoA C-acetyltransferase